ncbi:MAG: hypothetical protein PHS14_12010 [Elusimicrobia bacterium]|nr:hypothetical protein [Elusimicrobiota bacterium]
MFAIAVSAALAAPARALSPEAEAFVRKAGLDPASAAVRLADADGTIDTTYRGDQKSFSLESLALEKAKNGVNAFVTTRNFIHKLEADFRGTPIPKTGYDGLYLTTEQRTLVARKIIES